MTAYEVETNINTATLSVLHAFCAELLGGEPTETDSEKIYRELHPPAEDESTEIIEDETAYETLLEGVVSDELIDNLEKSTGVKSDHFRIGIYGVVLNTETGTVTARTRLQMDLFRKQDKQLELLYYRED